METQADTQNEQTHRAAGRASPRKPTHYKWAHFLPPFVDGSLGENLSLRKVHKATTKNFLCNLPKNLWQSWQNLPEHSPFCVSIIFLCFLRESITALYCWVVQFKHVHTATSNKLSVVRRSVRHRSMPCSCMTHPCQHPVKGAWSVWLMAWWRTFCFT